MLGFPQESQFPDCQRGSGTKKVLTRLSESVFFSAIGGLMLLEIWPVSQFQVPMSCFNKLGGRMYLCGSSTIVRMLRVLFNNCGEFV